MDKIDQAIIESIISVVNPDTTDTDQLVMEYLDGYFGGELNESTSSDDIVEAFANLLETADAVAEFMDLNEISARLKRAVAKKRYQQAGADMMQGKRGHWMGSPDSDHLSKQSKLGKAVTKAYTGPWADASTDVGRKLTKTPSKILGDEPGRNTEVQRRRQQGLKRAEKTIDPKTSTTAYRHMAKGAKAARRAKDNYEGLRRRARP